jgi:hypothetical protein
MNMPNQKNTTIWSISGNKPMEIQDGQLTTVKRYENEN